MNYKKVYYQIINKAKERNITKEEYKEKEIYVENHHILPKSLGGDDSEDNLVLLTAREHFMCHYLLAKMFKKETLKWYKVNQAFIMMKCSSFCRDRYYNSRLYEALKGNHSSVMSFLQSGSKNSQYGTMWISNIELKQSKKIKKTDEIPEGWVKGRNKWKRNKKTKVKCVICGNIFETIRSKYCSDDCRKKRIDNYKLSPETRKKMSEKAVLRVKLNPAIVHKNSTWINNGIINKRIQNDKQIPKGWMKGRI
jgi:hypothetical protein